MEILAAVLPVFCSAICAGMGWYLKTTVTRRKTEDKVFVILLRSHLRELYKIYTSDENISIDEYTEFCDMYELYHALGGNGTATKMMEEINKLKMRCE